MPPQYLCQPGNNLNPITGFVDIEQRYTVSAAVPAEFSFQPRHVFFGQYGSGESSNQQIAEQDLFHCAGFCLGIIQKRIELSNLVEMIAGIPFCGVSGYQFPQWFYRGFCQNQAESKAHKCSCQNNQPACANGRLKQLREMGFWNPHGNGGFQEGKLGL